MFNASFCGASASESANPDKMPITAAMGYTDKHRTITRDMVTTAGKTAFWATQFSPATTLLTVPLPWQLRTRTATTFASFATPTARPTAVLLTCVPCPSQSSASEDVSAKLYLHSELLKACLQSCTSCLVLS